MWFSLTIGALPVCHSGVSSWMSSAHLRFRHFTRFPGQFSSRVTPGRGQEVCQSKGRSTAFQFINSSEQQCSQQQHNSHDDRRQQSSEWPAESDWAQLRNQRHRRHASRLEPQQAKAQARGEQDRLPNGRLHREGHPGGRPRWCRLQSATGQWQRRKWRGGAAQAALRHWQCHLHVDHWLCSRSGLPHPPPPAYLYHHRLPPDSSSEHPAEQQHCQQGARSQSAVPQPPEQSVLLWALPTAAAVLSPGSGSSFGQHFLTSISHFIYHSLSWHLNSVNHRHFSNWIISSPVHFHRSLLVCNYLFLLSRMFTSFWCFSLVLPMFTFQSNKRPFHLKALCS